MKLTGILLLPLLALPAATFGQSSSVPQIAAVRGMLEENVTNKPVPASGLLVAPQADRTTAANPQAIASFAEDMSAEGR